MGYQHCVWRWALGGRRKASYIERSRAMMGFNRGIGLAIAVWALWLAGPAGAVENLDSGKTGAQLFASDCATCHKSAASLGKAGGLFGLSNFLRQHYTTSNQSAAVIAAYLESVGKRRRRAGVRPRPSVRPRATKRPRRAIKSRARLNPARPKRPSLRLPSLGRPRRYRASRNRTPRRPPNRISRRSPI